MEYHLTKLYANASTQRRWIETLGDGIEVSPPAQNPDGGEKWRVKIHTIQCQSPAPPPRLLHPPASPDTMNPQHDKSGAAASPAKEPHHG